MRFIIYGAGAVGGVVGAQLHKAGEDVVLIARGAHLTAIGDRGLRYQTPHEDTRLKIPAVGHPAEIGFRPDDAVVMTMKTQHTVGALEDLREVAGDDIPVICCQNGVANERLALRRFRRVYAMMVFLPAQMTEPGSVGTHMANKSGVLDMSVYPSGVDAFCEEVARRFENANFAVRPNPTVMRFKYEKLLMNLRNGLGAISPKGEVADGLFEVMKKEGRACFRAAGIDWATSEEVAERRGGNMVRGEIKDLVRMGGSSHQSLLRGTGDIETDYMNGEIVLLGRLHGVPTPANTVVQRLANRLARQKGRPAEVPIEEVVRLIEAERESQGLPSRLSPAAD